MRISDYLGNAKKEVEFDVSGSTPELTPLNGTTQSWILTGNSTPTYSFNSGESMTIFIADGTGFSVTWSVTWVDGVVPSIPETGYALITLTQKGSTLYGLYVGDVA